MCLFASTTIFAFGPVLFRSVWSQSTSSPPINPRWTRNHQRLQWARLGWLVPGSELVSWFLCCYSFETSLFKPHPVTTMREHQDSLDHKISSNGQQPDTVFLDFVIHFICSGGCLLQGLKIKDYLTIYIIHFIRINENINCFINSVVIICKEKT